ncbi:MAG: prepilin-type N-terminal cleavage/methylation domain-containing protein [Armatimonadetes bacterium]|nr:prepilin-type N-terminal cleavage/methylation domain-containing protein [Armatimonadota bacterium]
MAELVKKRSGFTLVEVLSAAVIMSIGLLAVIAASQVARDTQKRALYMSIGRTIAQSRMEKLRSLPMEQLDAQAGTTQNSSLPAGNSVQTIVEPYPTSSEPNMRRVTVVVRWPEGNGIHTVRYETLIVRK